MRHPYYNHLDNVLLGGKPIQNTAVISSKGQIVIPSALRRRYHLNEGTTVVFQEDSGRLVLEPRNYAALYALEGTLGGFNLEEDLQAERAAEFAREESR